MGDNNRSSASRHAGPMPAWSGDDAGPAPALDEQMMPGSSPTSRSICFCVIWDSISSSSSLEYGAVFELGALGYDAHIPPWGEMPLAAMKRGQGLTNGRLNGSDALGGGGLKSDATGAADLFPYAHPPA